MKRLLLILSLVVLLPGCSYILPLTNQPPRAYINAITPAEIVEGQTVTLSGHGTDADGQVVGYLWRSDIDGQLGSLPTIETSSLSVGEHTIYFMVQDNNDAWSEEVSREVTVSPGASAPARINSFSASSTTVLPGGSVTLSWNISNAATASINQGIGDVLAIGTIEVTPGVTTTYRLTATGGGSTATADVTVEVEEDVLDIVFFGADEETVASGETAELTWETTGATEVRIQPYIGVVEASGSREVSLEGDQVHTFTLIATDGEDTLTAHVEIESYIAMPEHYEVTLTADMNDSGYVRSTGAPWDKYIYVGDDNNNIGIQGFVTFDISDIPEDAAIASVEVDLSDYDSPLGTPFEDFGCLEAYAHNFGTLDGGDYWTVRRPSPIGVWCDWDDLDDPTTMSGFKNALQDRVGEDRFQFRLQFVDLETDEDDDNDLVRWLSGHEPVLTISYYSYE